ncbi:MAG: penicillin-binding transpeptidase domain-containing protein, partial [Candidatus Nanopelagicales bacterium]
MTTSPRNGGRRPATAQLRPRLVEPRRRVTAVGICLAIVLSLFVGRLVQLQGLEASAYAETASAERLRTVTIPATRGAITDIHGVALATTVDAVDITADQTQVSDPLSVAAALAPVVKVDLDELRGRLTGNEDFAYVAKNVSPATWRKVQELGLPGIYSEPTAERVYPQGMLAANILGFVGSDGKGLGGYEASLDQILAGRDGQTTFEAGAGGHQIPTGDTETEDSTPGLDVRLTIDRDIQFIAERALRRKVEESAAESGTVVAMDPRTGQILALASYPSFDPSDPLAYPAADRGNRAVSDIYEPGS